MRILLALCLALGLGAACDKPDIEDCRKACWNYNKLMYWEETDKMVAEMSPEEAARVRADREQEYEKIQQRVEDRGLLNCITNCQHQSSRKQVTCMRDAQSAEAMRSCMKD